MMSIKKLKNTMTRNYEERIIIILLLSGFWFLRVESMKDEYEEYGDQRV